MATTTSKAIRDRIIAVAAGLTPTAHAELPFVAYRDESGADFRKWARAHPALCTRRVQVRTVANVQTADVTNTDVEARLATFEVIVAYAKRWRAGRSFDRDDTMEADQLLIERSIGRDGYANFAGANPNASWLGAGANGSQTATLFERDDGPVDFLVIRQTMRFYRSNGGSIADPMASVTKDALSLKYWGATDAEWTTTLAVAGITSGNPFSNWLCQDLSGGLVDVNGAVTLNSNGGNAITYQNSIAGWASKAVGTANTGSGGFFSNTTAPALPNVSTTAMLVLGYVAIATPTVESGVLIAGNGQGLKANATTSLVPRAVLASTQTATGVSALTANGVHPWVLKIDAPNAIAKVYTDKEIVSPTWAAPASATALFVGGAVQPNTAANRYLRLAAFKGAAAQLSDAQVRALLQTLGWTTAW